MTAFRCVLSVVAGFILTGMISAEEARGRILRIDSERQEIRLERHRPRRGVLDVKIDAQTQIRIGGRPAKLDDLRPGRRIRVVFEVRDGKPVAQVIHSLGLNLLQSSPAASQPATPKEGEGIWGTLQRVSLTDREIVVIGPGSKGAETEMTIAVPEETLILREGKKISLDDLKEGEKVTVKAELRKGQWTAVSIQVGTVPTQSAASPYRSLIPRLRQVLKLADELLGQLDKQGK